MKTFLRVCLLCLAALVVPLTTDGGSGLEAQTPKHNCNFCHNLHGGDFGTLSDFSVSEDLCVSCHGDAGPAQVDRDGVLVTVPRQESIHNGALHSTPTSCWDCHDHEGSAGLNLSMIPSTRTLQGGGSATITFTNNATQADFTGTEGVCYGCHTDVQTQSTGLSGHNGPDVCTNCHSHDGGFQGVGGGCTACHNTGRGNHRPVVSEFDRPSHHIQLGGVAADIPDVDCQVCHDQVGHPRAGSDFVVLINQNDSSLIQYEVGVDPTSALTPFCLSCHDFSGADVQPLPLQPFTDGLPRPEIDPASWVASSHAASSDCADCHEGHGSEKVRLLAPGDVSPDPVTKVEEEEGFCLACHDSDGPSTIDLATARNLAINWVQVPTGLNADPFLNDRHDIEWAAQDSSGAKIECVNCHDPHVANSSLPFILDPDPGDGHVVGTDWYFAAYQAAGDTLSEFCLDCHDGSSPSSVLYGHGGLLTNIQTTWSGDGMGSRTASQSNLTPGTGWALGDVLACSDCHTAHIEIDNSTTSAGRTNLFRLRDQNYSKDGLTQLSFDDRGSPIFDYAVVDNLDKADETSGGYWCNTCHDRSSMTNKVNCYDCHRHGDGGRF